MKVPFLDLKAHHEPRRAELMRVIEEVVDSGAFAGGPYVEAFETDFARYCRTRHAVGVSSGTDALWLSLLALGIGPGDEVITVANSFFATVEAIIHAGATPVFVDIDEATYTMKPEDLAGVTTPRTKAIIPVHLFGQTADMDAILGFARENGLFVIEDAAQAHGAEHAGRRAGSLGDLGCFSFYPGKNLGALGEAGAVVTDDDELARRLRMLRDHGQERKYRHELAGWNSRMDGIQAAVLRLKLRDLDQNNRMRRAHARHFDSLLGDCEEIVTPVQGEGAKHVYHLYAVRVKERDQVVNLLSEREVGSGIHYPVPLHLQEACSYLGYGEGSFPVAESCAREYLSLPMYPELTTEMIEFVADALRGATRARLVA